MKLDSRLADAGAAPRRFWLGMAQMFAATTALVLLVSTDPQDPAAVEGPDDVVRRAFTIAFRERDARIKIVPSLRVELLDRLSLQREPDAIGRLRADRGEMELFESHVYALMRIDGLY